MKRERIFLDSSVWIAAILSESGGSRKILDTLRDQDLCILLSDRVKEEVLVNIGRKAPSFLQKAHFLLSRQRIRVSGKASMKQIVPYLEILPKEDAQVFAEAYKARAIHFITLDQKHFIACRQKLQKLSGISIFTPGEFIQKHFYV